MIILLISCLVVMIKTGTITQGLNSAPIYNSVSNANVKALYQFNFIVSTYLPAGGILEIVFPNQYAIGLGIATNQIRCSVPCTLTGLTVDFTFQSDLVNGTTQNVQIQNVTNPALRGGTGNFILRTLRGKNVLDENLIFGLIGIADAIIPLTYGSVVLAATGSQYAGDYTSYALLFKTTNTIADGSYIIFTVDSNFTIEPFPACFSPPLNGYIIGGDLFCSLINGTSSIMVQGVSGQIIGLVEYSLQFSVQNSIYGGTSTTFSIGVYRSNTQTMYEQLAGIPGVPILAAQLNSVSMVPLFTNVINSMSRIMDYVVKFTPTFPIPAGCNIKIIFPAYMQILTNAYFGQPSGFQLHFINYGLEDINNGNIVQTIYYDNIQNYLRFVNFRGMTMTNEISITIRVKNPAAAGITTPLKIYVFQDITEYNLMAQDVVNAKWVVMNIPSGLQTTPFPSTTTLTSTTTIANGQLIAQISFSMNPTMTVPKLGYLVITVPPQFQIAGTFSATNCQILTAGVWLSSLACTAINQVITLQLTATFAFDVLLLPTYQFQLNQMVYAPSSNGTYYFDVTSYDTDGVSVLDSYAQFFVVDANPINIFTVKSLPNFQGADSIIDISFMNILTIPSGQVQHKASDVQGFFELHFTTSWAMDLGTGNLNAENIPCYGVNGLVPASGDQISCILKLGTLTTPPIVVVTNFRPISANSQVRLLISGLDNPVAASYNILLKVFVVQNRVYTLLNTKNALGVLIATGATPFTCSNVPQYSESRVGFLFDLLVTPCLQANVIGGSYILVQLPTYDVGFVQLANTITCQIANVDVYCIPHQGSDYVFIVSPHNNLIVSSAPQIRISNLQWPRYVQSFAVGYQLVVQVIDPNSQAQLQYIVHNQLANAVPAGFNQILSVVPKKGNSFVDASYTFTFYPQALIPDGSTIILQFPPIYNLLSGAQPPTFQQGGLAPSLINGGGVSIVVNLVLIKVINFGDHASGQPFTLTASGISNPNALQSVGWCISATLNNNLILQQTNFFSFTFTTPFKAGVIVFNQITATNLNADEQADYTIAFTPQTDIPVGGLIEIILPADYKNVPSVPLNRVSGGMTSYNRTYVTGNTFCIVTNLRYTVGAGVITYQLLGVYNPDVGTTAGFVVQTSFGGIYLDVTDNTTTNGRTFTSYAKVLPIQVVQVTFNPKNEGEEAAYFFSFLTGALDATKEIVFLFPVQYDALLGREIQCVVSGGLVGADYQCSVSSGRAVHLTKFLSYSPSTLNPINVTIFGIVNPNANSVTDYIKIITAPLHSLIYDAANDQAAQMTFYAAPGWSPLYSILPDTLAVRFSAQYSFTFLTSSNIPKQSNQGAILFDFPKQFQVPDGIVPCSTDTNFAPLPTCTFYRNRMTFQGNFKDYVGLLTILIQQVLNPTDKGSCDFLYVRTYDGLNTQIIERNFANLDPFTFTYFYPGPLIKVNNDQTIIVERGTQAVNVPISVQSACVLNLRLHPALQPVFSLQPPIIQLPLGVMLTYVTLSLPESMEVGDYVINWVLDGELTPPLYTPVKSTIVHVTATLATQLLQTPILDIPLLGWSLLTEYALQAPADIGVSYQLTLLSSYRGIALSDNNLVFVAGQVKAGFAVVYQANITHGALVERGYVSITAGGTDQYVYQLASQQVQFNLIAQDTKLPRWEILDLPQIMKTSVVLQVQADEPIMVYYLLALRGTLLPTLREMQDQVVRYASTESQYGYMVVVVPGQRYRVTITNLTAETDYVVHVYGMDRGYNLAPTTSLTFSTQVRPNACDFTLRFNKDKLDYNYVQGVLEGIAFVLGLPTSSIQQQIYYFELDELDGRRVLQNTFEILVDEVATYLNLQMSSNAHSETFPSPIDVVSQFQNKTQLLLARLPDLDLKLDPVSVLFKRYKPQFVVRPHIVFLDFRFCALKVQLSNYGYVYMTAVKFESHNQTLPTPYQISRGLDYQNRVTPHGTIEISEPYQDFIVVVQGLQPETDYFIYCVGGSVQPGQPDLMIANEMFSDRIISFSSPPSTKYNIEVIKFLG